MIFFCSGTTWQQTSLQVLAIKLRASVQGRTRNFDWDAVLEAFEVQDRKATVSLYFTRWHRQGAQSRRRPHESWCTQRFQ